MPEVKSSDLQEIKKPPVDSFRDIVPEHGTTIAEARAYWDNIGRSDVSSDVTVDEKSINDACPKYTHTRNESLENDRHPITGVWFEKRVIKLPDNDRIEGVFPKFESLFDAKVTQDLFLQPDKAQFRECNKQLAAAIEHKPDLKARFTPEQLEQIYDGIYDGTAPDGYVWHHDAEIGKIQLVDFETHSFTGHTGGRYIWGGGTENR